MLKILHSLSSRRGSRIFLNSEALWGEVEELFGCDK